MKSKTYLMAGIVGAGMLSSVMAGEGASIHPITNPVYADTAIPESKITVIGAHHRLPDKINTILGKVPLGGDVNVLAVQVEYAFNDSLSLTAIKDGYVDFNPDNTLSSEEGFNDLALGLKWRFHHDDGLSLAFRGTVELSTGDDEIFQGNGDGNFSPALIITHQHDKGQCNTVIGATLPFDGDEESTMSYVSLGYARQLTDRLSLIGELNWLRVLDEGDGSANYGASQLGAAVPTIVEFEGPDLFNLGSANGDDNPDAVTVALGVRYQLTDNVNAGIAYEHPLTDEEDGLFEDRVTLSVTVHY